MEKEKINLNAYVKMTQAEGYRLGCKETAEKIMQDLKPLLEGFVHTDTGENLYVYKCKQFDVEIKE